MAFAVEVFIKGCAGTAGGGLWVVVGYMEGCLAAKSGCSASLSKADLVVTALVGGSVAKYDEGSKGFWGRGREASSAFQYPVSFGVGYASLNIPDIVPERTPVQYKQSLKCVWNFMGT